MADHLVLRAGDRFEVTSGPRTGRLTLELTADDARWFAMSLPPGDEMTKTFARIAEILDG